MQNRKRHLLCCSNIAVTAFVLAILLSSPSHAADIGCGRDTDRSGTVDNLCPGNDQDFDGYTVAQGDCDDTKFDIFPGRPDTSGCSAGQYRACKADGTGWTSCTATATTPYCPTGDYAIVSGKPATQCKYISPSGNDTTGDGSYANPWASPNKISANNASKYSLQSGDAIVILSGTYTETARMDATNDTVMFINRTATSANPIFIVGYPGTKPVFQGSANFYDSHYFVIRDIEITQGSVSSSGFVGRGPSSDFDIAGLYVHDKTGNREDNMSCIHLYQGGSNWNVHHNYVHDCNDPPDGTQPNGAGIYLSALDAGIKANYNNVIASSGGLEYCLYEKHGTLNTTNGELLGNYCQNGSVGYKSSGAKNRTYKYNLSVGCNTGFYLASSAGQTYWGGTTIENNTFICNSMGGIKPWWGYDSTGTLPLTDECSCTYGTDCGAGDFIPSGWSQSYVRYNITSSTATTFDYFTFGQYESDTTKTLIDGKFTFASNGIYSSGSSSPKFLYFDSNNSCSTYCCGGGSQGAVYTGLSSIQGAGFETSSLNANPSLASGTYIPANESMTGWGYMVASEEDGSLGVSEGAFCIFWSRK